MPQQGWTPVPEPAAAPAGWTPVEPTFRAQNERDAGGNAVVRPSMGGFAENVLTSGANFVENVVAPVMHPIETVKGLVAAARQPGETGRALMAALTKRYGSVDAVLGTAYRDPVGMVSDLSLLFGGAARVATLAGAPRAANTMRAAATVTNPMAVPAQLAQTGGRAAYGAAINPSRRIRQGFPGAVDEGYRSNILPTEGGLVSTEYALEQSAAHTASRLAEADRLGAPGVTMNQVAPSIAAVRPEATRRYQLGHTDEMPALRDRAAAMHRRNPQPIPNADANKLKQTAQTLADTAFRAQERGALIKDLDAMADLKVAQAYRKAIETNAATVGVRDIAQSNERTQALIGLAQALEDATNQPSRLTHLIATLGGIGGATGAGLPGGAAAYTAARVLTAKPVMAATGIGVGKGGSAALRNAQIVRALAVLQASLEQEQPNQEPQQGP